MADTAMFLGEVASRLRRSRQAIYAMHERGELTIRKLGGRSYVLASEVERLLLEGPALPRHSADNRAA